MTENTITVAKIIETKWGEKAVIDSPFEAKDYIKHLPFKQYQQEVDEYGSLKEKAAARGTNVKTSQLFEVFDAMETYGFPNTFATHVSWDPDALDGDGAWTIDRDAVETAADFWQFVGFNVQIEANL